MSIDEQVNSGWTSDYPPPPEKGMTLPEALVITGFFCLLTSFMAVALGVSRAF